MDPPHRTEPCGNMVFSSEISWASVEMFLDLYYMIDQVFGIALLVRGEDCRAADRVAPLAGPLSTTSGWLVGGSYHKPPYRKAAAACSIPFLDLPPGFFACRGEGEDYGEIFSRFGFADFALPYEDLFGAPQPEVASSSGSSRFLQPIFAPFLLPLCASFASFLLGGFRFDFEWWRSLGRTISFLRLETRLSNVLVSC
jgi:hypothetical protein